MSERKIIAYQLQPVYETPPDEFAMETAALMTCLATGEVLSGMGGGGLFLSPEVVERLRAAGEGGNG